MPGDPFVHLHVASGYSLRHGASHPHVLVERAAEHGMDSLALTDRDGVYGAVRFAKACMAAGIRPVLGVDLAVEPVLVRPPGAQRTTSPRRTPAPRGPARGGAFVDPRLPRVTVLAQGKAGWAALCRLTSATHLRGERGTPISTRELIGEHVAASGGSLVVMLGLHSELAQALSSRRPDLARAHLDAWRAITQPGDLVVEVVHHRGRGDAVRASRLAGWAGEVGVPVVLSNQVRYADRSDAPTADVLDAARRLVALDERHVDRTNAEGYLKSGKEMSEVAEEVAAGAGLDHRQLLARTRVVADRCALDPRADLGLGEVHFPELETSFSGSDPGLAGALLRQRCEAGLGHRGMAVTGEVRERLDHELQIIEGLGYPTYFHTVADVVDLIRSMGVRCAARGSGAGSLVTYLLRISDVDPLEHGLVMERFLSPLRHALPDIDVDVESARRTEIYEQVLAKYGGERCACVAMMDTYKVRHAIRDVGAALGMPPGEIDSIAKAFPHIRASQARAAMRDLPELRASGLSEARLDVLFSLVERLDGLPRHIALHPCGVLLSDATLLDRTPVEASFLGFPMSQFDKDDVEDLGLLKLDVLGVRMQSAMAYAVQEVERVDGVRVDVDTVPRDDPATYALVQSTRTLGCFQIESPGQRELVGKFAPETFTDLIIDISLFRPGPVKSDMVRPFLEARQGWAQPRYLHPDLEPALAETWGVVVFHEQVLRIVSVMTGCSLAEADEVRRALGTPEGQEDVRIAYFPAALGRGYPLDVVEQTWEVLKAFASFGFCKAHAAAFALPTYQSAWLKAHHPAAFLAGVLTHDPGMYPKRLILDDARQFGIAVLPLDVNRSDASYRVERVGVYDEPPPEILDQVGAWARPLLEAGADQQAACADERAAGGDERAAGVDLPVEMPPDLGPRPAPPPGLPDARGYGIRLALADVKGISDAEVASLVVGRPYASLADFWHRAGVSRPIVERIVLAGGFDSLYGLGSSVPGRRRRGVNRRDLLLQVAELDHWSRAVRRSSRSPARRRTAAPASSPAASPALSPAASPALSPAASPAAHPTTATTMAAQAGGVREQAARQSRAARPVAEHHDVQLALDLGDDPSEVTSSGLPELTSGEQVHAELEILGLDASRHVLDFYEPFFAALQVVRSRDMLRCRSQQEVLIAGVKVATQTPPIRSGKRVVFVTLDDATGPVDATFFEDAQGPYAMTVFHSWLLVIRGVVRRTGPRGVSVRALGAWELPVLREHWVRGGLDAVREAMRPPEGVTEEAVRGAAGSRSTRPVMVEPPVGDRTPVLLHASGFKQSPYADIRPSGADVKGAPRRLWHSSPGSSGG